jgi:hypothetical protein
MRVAERLAKLQQKVARREEELRVEILAWDGSGVVETIVIAARKIIARHGGKEPQEGASAPRAVPQGDRCGRSRAATRVQLEGEVVTAEALYLTAAQVAELL